EPFQPGPQPDVGGRGVLRLEPADAFNRTGDREVRRFEQELPGEQRAVAFALGKGALGHGRSVWSRSVSAIDRNPRRATLTRLLPMADQYLPSAIESPPVVVSNRGPVTFEPHDAGRFEAQRGAVGLLKKLAGASFWEEAS